MLKPYYQDLHNTLYNMDFRENDLPDGSVQCVVTSPPYWGLRKYSGEQELIWGDNYCEHQWYDTSLPKSGGVGDYEVGRVGNAKARSDSHDKKESSTCSLCGAWKGAYGLETTPEMYVHHTIEILREIRRVLRKDGIVFWNCGDSYYASGGAGGDYNKGGLKEGQPKYKQGKGKTDLNLKPKDLCLIPFRVAIAAQEDGWWVRSDIIWSKPNPIPESVTDRPTNSHEHILMLTKSAKYYWDQEAVREPNLPQSIERAKHAWKQHKTNDMVAIHNVNTDRMGERFVPEAGRNIRDVWEFPTQPYPEAHFAVFPEKLPEICIKAASREGDLILDPFAGAGTTLWVAKKLNRKAVGFEISEEYCKLALERNRQQVLI